MAPCLGLRFALLTQPKETVTERFTTIWQPRDLPATRLMNESQLLIEPNTEEKTMLLEVLDYFAMYHTLETLKYVIAK